AARCPCAPPTRPPRTCTSSSRWPARPASSCTCSPRTRPSRSGSGACAPWGSEMAIRTEKLTIKAQEALADARDVAAGRGHPEITALPLLVALLQQEDGVAPRLLAKLGADPKAILREAERELEGLPTVRGAGLEVGIGRSFRELYDAAAKQAA